MSRQAPDCSGVPAEAQHTLFLTTAMHLLLGEGVVAVPAGGALVAAARRAVALVPCVPAPLIRPVVLQVPWDAYAHHGTCYLHMERSGKVGSIQTLLRGAFSPQMH